MKIKLNDKVVVISGKDKGKTGKVTRVIAKHNQIVVEKMNIRTKHVKKTTSGPGQKITFEAPMNVSNVMMIDPVQNKPARVGYRVLESGKRERFSKLSGQALDTVATDAAPKKTSKKKSI